MPNTIPTPETSRVMRRILDKLELHGPMTMAEIADRCLVAVSTLSGGAYLLTLHKTLKLIHISGWVRNPRGPASAIYAIGEGDDAPKVRQSLEESNSPGLKAIVDAIERLGPMTGKEVAQFSGVSYTTIKGRGYMQVLKKQGKVHISGWRRQRSANMAPIYSAGAGEDCPKPEPYRRAERLRRIRETRRLKKSSMVGIFVGQALNKPVVSGLGSPLPL